MTTYGCCDATCSLCCPITALASRIPRFPANYHVETWRRGNVLFLQSLPQPLANCNNRCKMLGTICRRMTFGTFKTACMRDYTPLLPPEWALLSIDMTVWVPLTVTCVSFCLNLSYTPITINYLSHQFSIQWASPRRCWIFSVVYVWSTFNYGLILEKYSTHWFQLFCYVNHDYWFINFWSQGGCYKLLCTVDDIKWYDHESPWKFIPKRF